MNAETIGRRIAEARGRAGLTQGELAAAVQLDRSALTKVESGQRRVSALELARIADALDVRIEWFVEEAPAAIVSRRNVHDPGAPSPRIDSMVERITREVEFAIGQDERFVLPSLPTQKMPENAAQAEALASTARTLIGIEGDSPCTQLAKKVATCGLLAFSIDLGIESADAATILLHAGGISLVNGVLRVGRRRLALAHELGHYLVADDYTVDWRVAEYQSSERREYLLDRFARALLLPESGLRANWARYASGDCDDMRTAAVRIASSHQVDMATLARRLLELNIVSQEDARQIRSIRTTRADIVELDLLVGDELDPPTLPREYEIAVLRLYRSESISAARTLDLLLDTWTEEMLPKLPKRTEDEIWQYI